MVKKHEAIKKIGHYPFPAIEKETGRESTEKWMLPSGGYQVCPDAVG
jgi:hypothetical protein